MDIKRWNIKVQSFPGLPTQTFFYSAIISANDAAQSQCWTIAPELQIQATSL